MSEPTSMGQRTFDGATVVEHARAGAEAIRAINHLTRGGPLPSPLVYEILGALEEAAQRLPQALDQITNALGDSVLHHDLTDAPGRDPQYSIIEAGTIWPTLPAVPRNSARCSKPLRPLSAIRATGCLATRTEPCQRDQTDQPSGPCRPDRS